MLAFSIRNVPFHIDAEVLKGGVRRGRTVALAISGQKTSSFPKNSTVKEEIKKKEKAAHVCSLGKNYSDPICDLSETLPPVNVIVA